MANFQSLYEYESSDARDADTDELMRVHLPWADEAETTHGAVLFARCVHRYCVEVTAHHVLMRARDMYRVDELHVPFTVAEFTPRDITNVFILALLLLSVALCACTCFMRRRRQRMVLAQAKRRN
jgi:hypothetical protein